MVILRKNFRVYKFTRGKFNGVDPEQGDCKIAGFTKKPEVSVGMSKDPKMKGRRLCRSFDNLDRIVDEECANGEVNDESIGMAERKPGLMRRIFKKKYKKLERSRSNESLPTEAVNISMDDTRDQRVRDRSRTVPSELWDESTEKGKRRGAVSENDDLKKEQFTKILETFMIRKHMDDYGF